MRSADKTIMLAKKNTLTLINTIAVPNFKVLWLSLKLCKLILIISVLLPFHGKRRVCFYQFNSGFDSDLESYSNDTYIFDIPTARWFRANCAGTPARWRDFHTAVEMNSRNDCSLSCKNRQFNLSVVAFSLKKALKL